MKKISLLFFCFFSLLCIQINIYSEETNKTIFDNNSTTSETTLSDTDTNISVNDTTPAVTDDDQDSYPSPYQPEYKPAFMRMFLILFALLVLIFLTFWMIKRIMNVKMHQANMTKSIKILEKRALSPKSILYLIEVEGKKIVVSESNLEVRKIKDID